jgi:hypothetical protein
MEEDNSFFQPEERRSLEARVNTLEPISSSQIATVILLLIEIR